MYECNYSREPVDFRLLGLKILKKIWWIPLAAIIGAAVIFGAYFFGKVVVNGRSYQVTNIYYIDFAEDSSGAQYDWVNQYTWCELSDMDIFINPVYESLGGTVAKEDLIKYTDCTIEADGRYLYFRTSTPDPELSKKVALAYEKALINYTDAHKEFNSIVKESGGDAIENTNLRIGAVCLIGAIVGLVLLVLIWTLIDINDTSIYIPATLEWRYHVTCLGAPSMPEYEETSEDVLYQVEKVAVVKLEESSSSPAVYAEEGITVDYFENPINEKGTFEKLKEYDKVLVAVKYGAHNGKRLERLIEACKRLDINIAGTILCDEDEKLIKRYYKF